MLALHINVKFVNNVTKFDVTGEGRKIRFSDKYNTPDQSGNTGANINFVEIISDDVYRLRTYERTVEGETKACGTGSVSAAIAIAVKQSSRQNNPNENITHKKVIVNNGGNLIISFIENTDTFSNVILSGPAQKAFTGLYFLPK